MSKPTEPSIERVKTFRLKEHDALGAFLAIYGDQRGLSTKDKNRWLEERDLLLAAELDAVREEGLQWVHDHVACFCCAEMIRAEIERVKEGR